MKALTRFLLTIQKHSHCDGISVSITARESFPNNCADEDDKDEFSCADMTLVLRSAHAGGQPFKRLDLAGGLASRPGPSVCVNT